MSSVDELSKQVAGLNSEIKALKQEIKDLKDFKKENSKARKEVKLELQRRAYEGKRLQHCINRAKCAESLVEKIEKNYGSTASETLLANFDGINIKVENRIAKLESDLRSKSISVSNLEEELDEEKKKNEEQK